MPISDRISRFRRIFLSTFMNQILIFGIQFLGSIVIVKALSIPDYATYILFNTTLNLATNLANLGLRAYLTRFVPGATRQKGTRILWAVLAGQFAASLLVLLAAMPVALRPPASWLEKFHVQDAGILFACFAGSLLLSFMPRQFAGYFRYLDEDHKSANRLQLVSALAFPSFLILSFFTRGTLTLTWVLAGMVGAHLVSVGSVLFLTRGRAVFPGAAAMGSELKSALAYSWPFAFLPVAQQFMELGNRFFLAGYGTAVDLASFSFNYGICNAGFTLINTSLGFTFFPAALRLFNEGKRREGILLNLKGTLACAALVIVFFVCFWMAAPMAFMLLDREILRLSTLPLALICVSFVAQSLGQQGNFLLQAYNLRISNVGITLTGVAFSIALNFLLIRRYNVGGAAVALALTSLLVLLLNLLPLLLIRKEKAA